MKHLKHILITVIIAMLTTLFLVSGAALYAEDDEYDVLEYSLFDFSDEEDFTNTDNWSVENINDAYLEEMNKYFNDNFTQLEKILKKQEFSKLLVPAETNGKILINLPIYKTGITPEKKEGAFYYDDICKGTKKNSYKNVSSYCVALGATKAHLIFIQKIQTRIDSTKFKTKYNPLYFEIKAIQLDTIVKMQGEVNKNNEYIKEAIKRSESTIRQTIEIYDEFKLAYPMHKKLQKIRGTLISYKLAMKKLAQESQSIPGKFIDVTSKTCE